MEDCIHYWKLGRTLYDEDTELSVTRGVCSRCSEERTFSSETAFGRYDRMINPETWVKRQQQQQVQIDEDKTAD
jgi:hypothetical protein